MTRKFGDTIKMLRTEHGQSQEQLADILSISRSTLANYETNRRIPDRAILEAVADYYNVDMDFIYGRTDTRNAYQMEKNSPIALSRAKTIPIIGDVACGSPIYHPGDGDEMVTVYDFDQADCAVRARGDSMEPLIQDGDLVMIHSQPMVDDGQIAAVVVDNEVTLKRVYYEPGRLLILSALNSDYAPITISGPDIDQTRIIGRAIGKQARW